ncbi:MAG: FKBP-type peptidyl-prolyl cis-trans isomerase [Planctomycetota bacterium]|jgi:FKBP-type peptidyl-prolyl cis-trans isomerase
MLRSVVAAVLLTAVVFANSASAADKKLVTEDEKFSYSIGMDVAKSLQSLKGTVNVDVNLIVKGLLDSVSGKPGALTDQEAAAVRQSVITKLQAAHQQKMQKKGSSNIAKGQAFLAANKKKKGVVTTASGLQYMVLKNSKGAKPTAADTVTVNYRGTLLDGTEFDSSYKRNKPISFPLNGVIKGWTEGVQLMGVGSKYKLFIPSELAYGPRGAGGVIGPNATLIFEIELLSIKGK